MEARHKCEVNFSRLCYRVGLMTNSLIASHYFDGGDLVWTRSSRPFFFSTKNNPISHNRPLFLIVASIFQPNISKFLILLFLSLTLWDDSLKRYMRLEITPLEFRMLERFLAALFTSKRLKNEYL